MSFERSDSPEYCSSRAFIRAREEREASEKWMRARETNVGIKSGSMV